MIDLKNKELFLWYETYFYGSGDHSVNKWSFSWWSILDRKIDWDELVRIVEIEKKRLSVYNKYKSKTIDEIILNKKLKIAHNIVYPHDNTRIDKYTI